MIRNRRTLLVALCAIMELVAARVVSAQTLGREVALPVHLGDGDEFSMSLRRLFKKGERIFKANWTAQEGGGRPNTKGTGAALSDPSDPLLFPRSFNRISAPDANSCAGCHNVPFAGGGGDFVANVFVLGQRFDFATFDQGDTTKTKGALDENGNPVVLQDIANSRNTLGMFGSGFIEMLARRITRELQQIRDSIAPSGSAPLTSHGISFGTLARDGSGNWDTSLVEGIAEKSLVTSGPSSPPSLIIRPFHQAGAVISLREFSNNAYNHHHGMQSVERFGAGDQDGDGFVNELTIGDITAATIYQAGLAVPGRVIPNDATIEQAVTLGEQRFCDIGCTTCHMPCLELDDKSWVLREPNPFNAAGNLRVSDAYVTEHGLCKCDLTSDELPAPRIKPSNGVVHVHAFTDLKLHDITTGAPDDPNREKLNMQWPPSDARFFAGNARFLTRKLWGCANEPPYYHHGQYTTLRHAIEAHAGEATAAHSAWVQLPANEKDAIIEFLKTLQVLPPGTQSLVVDENYNARQWQTFPCGCSGG